MLVTRAWTVRALSAASPAAAAAATSTKKSSKKPTKQELSYAEEQHALAHELAGCATAREVEAVVLIKRDRKFNAPNTSSGMLFLGKLASQNLDAKNRLLDNAKRLTEANKPGTAFTPEEMTNLCLGVGLHSPATSTSASLPSYLTKQLTPAFLELFSQRQLGTLVEAMAVAGGKPKEDVLDAVADQLCDKLSKNQVEDDDDHGGSIMGEVMHSFARLPPPLPSAAATRVSDVVCAKLRDMGNDEIARRVRPKEMALILASLGKLGDTTRAKLCEKYAISVLANHNNAEGGDVLAGFDAVALNRFLDYAAATTGSALPDRFVEWAAQAVDRKVLQGLDDEPQQPSSAAADAAEFEAKYYFAITDKLARASPQVARAMQTEKRGADFYMPLFANLYYNVFTSESSAGYDEASRAEKRENIAAADQVVQHLAEHAQWSAFSPEHVLAVLHLAELFVAAGVAAGSANDKPAAAAAVVASLSRALSVQQLGTFSTPELSMLARSLHTTSSSSSSSHSQDGDADRVVELFRLVCQDFCSRSDSTVEATDSYLMIEAMVKLGHRDLAVCEKISRLTCNDKLMQRSFRSHQLAFLVDALSTLGYKDNMLLAVLQRELDKTNKSLTWPKPV